MSAPGRGNYYALYDRPVPENLEANQQGRLTPEQRTALDQRARYQRSMVMFWVVIVLSVVSFMVFFLWQVGGKDGLFTVPSIVTIGLVALGVVLLVLFLSGGDILFTFSRDEIENGQVDSVVGKVVWMGNRYRVMSDSRKLQSLRSGRALPPPGDYRFYCLPRSGLVIMAEELGLVPASQPSDLLLEALARANHFSMEDLKTNRKGALSGRQELRLIGHAAMLVALLLLCIGVGIIAVHRQFLGENSLTLLVIVGVILLLRVGWGIIRILWDIWNGNVNHSAGRVTRHMHHARNIRYYTYQVNGLKFHVSQSAYNALIEGKEYQVYFVPRSKRLVAIEPI